MIFLAYLGMFCMQAVISIIQHSIIWKMKTAQNLVNNKIFCHAWLPEVSDKEPMMQVRVNVALIYTLELAEMTYKKRTLHAHLESYTFISFQFLSMLLVCSPVRGSTSMLNHEIMWQNTCRHVTFCGRLSRDAILLNWGRRIQPSHLYWISTQSEKIDLLLVVT